MDAPARPSVETSADGHAVNGTAIGVGNSSGEKDESFVPPESSPLAPVPISVTPASPAGESFPSMDGSGDGSFDPIGEGESSSSVLSAGTSGTARIGNGSSIVRNGTMSEKNAERMGGEGKRVKRVQRMVKKSVHAGQARIGSISRKIGHEVRRTGSVNLRRSRSVSGKFLLSLC